MNKLASFLTWTEKDALRLILNKIGDNDSLRLVVNNLAVGSAPTRAVFVTVQRKLEIAELIETRSMGVKGTMLIVLDKEKLKELRSLI